MTDELTLAEAARLGAEKTGAINRPASDSKYSAHGTGSINMMAGTPVGGLAPLPPGYTRSPDGLTIWSPKRNDPIVESVLGEHKYRSIPYPDSPEQLKLQRAKSENEIAKLKAQVQALMVMIAGKGEQPKVEETISEPEPVEPEETETSIGELRAQAKELGINTLRMKKSQIVMAIHNAKKK